MTVKRKFDPSKPLRTASGMNVAAVIFQDKIMGVVYDNEATDGHFCTWNMDGERVNIFPRKKGDNTGSDLVNFVVEQASDRNK